MNATKPPPLYERVKQHLLTRIQSGEWQNGGRLPSEYELMDTLGASRMTIHRALREMQTDGMLHRIQGVGTFIQNHPHRSALIEITDIATDILHRGNQHHTKIITLETIRADTNLAATFSLPKGAKIFHSTIIHTENNTPIQLEDRLVSPLFAPHYLEQNFATQTTTSYLATLPPPTHIEHAIHAITPPHTTQKYLQITGTTPCLQLTRKTWTTTGPATQSTLTHPPHYSLGSRYDPTTPIASLSPPQTKLSPQPRTLP